jgi:hypothetical protein
MNEFSLSGFAVKELGETQTERTRSQLIRQLQDAKALASDPSGFKKRPLSVYDDVATYSRAGFGLTVNV